MHCQILNQACLHSSAVDKLTQRPACVVQPVRCTTAPVHYRGLYNTSQTFSSRTGVRCAAQDFNHQLQQLSDWKAIFGTCYVPQSAYDAANLSSWVQWARKAAKQGQLSDEQKQQLESLAFIFKPNVIDAKWHHTYHSLRCLLDSGDVTLQQILQQQQRQQKQRQQQHGGQQPHMSPQQQQDDPQQHFLSQQQQQRQWQDGKQLQQQQHELQQQQPHQQQQQQQHNAEVHELSLWLNRQIELYGKLKLTPVKAKLLRKLGVKLHRQSGLNRDTLHPVLQGVDPDSYKRRPIIVKAASVEGRRAVGRLLQQYQNWQQQWQQQQQQQQQQQGEGPKQPAFEVHDADSAFMCMLAQLQKWRKRYGSCVVPAGVFDKPELAWWVQQLRKARASASTVPAIAENLSQQQQQQGWLLAAAAVPSKLKSWHIQELDAVGFCWNTKQVDIKWHEQYHRLRRFKHTHHHLNAPATTAAAATAAAKSVTVAATAAEAAVQHTQTAAEADGVHISTPSSSSSSSSSEEQWDGLSEWLQQQRELLGFASWGVTQLSGSQDALAQRKPLTKLQRKLLKDLGVQPLPVLAQQDWMVP